MYYSVDILAMELPSSSSKSDEKLLNELPVASDNKLILPVSSSSSDKEGGERRQPLARKLFSLPHDARANPRNGGDGDSGLKIFTAK